MYPAQYRFRSFLGSCLLAVLANGCGDTNTYAPPPAPKVTVATPLIQDVTDYLEFTGTTEASEWAEARARVPGVLQSMHFEPGADVQEGDLLFVIDPAEYEADLQAAEAELAAAKAQYDRANTEFQRAEKLYKQKAGAEAEVVKWRVEREVASAEILRAQAKVDRAKLNIGYTQVTAPIDGRVGRDLVEIGNLVGEGEPTVLTDVTDFNPMYVYFNLNERDLLRVMEIYRRKLEAEGIDAREISDKELEIPLQLGLANEEGYPHEGMYDFGESSLDPDTGTVQLRGVFENPGSIPVLLPGLFARIRMPLGERPDMPLVSEQALGTDQSGSYLMVVNSEDTVERRNVRTGQLIDGLLVIEDGLQPGDRVIVKGLQRARPGLTVEPEQVDMASLRTSVQKEEAAVAPRSADVTSAAETE